MAPPPSNRDLDFLLARGRLPGPEKERIKERLLASARPGRLGPNRLLLALGAGIAALALGSFLVFPRLQDSGFSVKGAGVGGTSMTMECTGGSTNACPVGSTLLFVVSGSSRPGFLAGYAEPEAGGERIWYFSAEAGAPPVAANLTVPLRRGILLGDEHRPGRYRVRLFLSGSAPARAEILSGQAPDLFAETELLLTVVAR